MAKCAVCGSCPMVVIEVDPSDLDAVVRMIPGQPMPTEKLVHLLVDTTLRDRSMRKTTENVRKQYLKKLKGKDAISQVWRQIDQFGTKVKVNMCYEEDWQIFTEFGSKDKLQPAQIFSILALALGEKYR